MAFRKITRRVLIALALSAFALGSAPACHKPPTGQAQPRLKIEPLSIETAAGEIALKVEVAETPEQQQMGLMFRPKVPRDEGMLFIFPRPKEASFWMKNTPEPLDIIYISPGGRIISIARNAKPFSEDPLPSGGATLGVLEIAGGRTGELGIREGDRVRHRIFP